MQQHNTRLIEKCHNFFLTFINNYQYIICQHCYSQIYITSYTHNIYICIYIYIITIQHNTLLLLFMYISFRHESLFYYVKRFPLFYLYCSIIIIYYYFISVCAYVSVRNYNFLFIEPSCGPNRLFLEFRSL